MLKPFNMCKSQRTGCSNSLCFIFLLVLLSTLVFSISSCKQLFEGNNEKENASIALQLPATRRTLEDTAQNYAEITKHYEVSFIRSGISDITVKGLPGETVNSGEILAGSYDVEVYAYSEENKKIGYGKKSNVIVVAGETTFITINISAIKEPTASSDNSDDEQLPDEAIGTKAKPTAVGDIVFSDGTAIAYSADADFELTEIQKTEAVAVIFYATGRVLGVGLDESGELMWAANGTLGYERELETTDLNTTLLNGSNNWGKITAIDSTADSMAATKYPAFNYANTYSAPGYTSGWYLPSKSELQSLYSNRATVNSAINKIGTSSTVKILSTSSRDYWTSSQANTGAMTATYVNFSTGSTTGTTKSDTCYVRAIHEFE